MSPLSEIRRFLASHTEMSSATQPRQGFPAVPSSLNAGDHEMRNWPAEYDVHANTSPSTIPYLGLRARLSQVWINRWTVLLLLILCRLLLATTNLDYDMANAKSEALSACTSVENVGSAMASMPHYMSEGVNALAAETVTKAFNAMMDMVMMALTGVEEIILFLINMYTSTYVCLITLAVSGSLHVAIEMIEAVGEFMNKTIADITSGMSSDLTSFQNGLNSFLSGLKIPSIFGGSSSPPSINLTSAISELNGIKIDPTTMDADLTKLNNSIPTFADVQNFTNQVISFPFDEVKKLVNNSKVAFKFDKSVFPLAQKKALTFCSDNNTVNNFFDDLIQLVFTARKVFIAILIIAAVLACVPMAWKEIRAWRKMQERALLIRSKAEDPMDVIYIASRPYTSSAGFWVASKFGTPKRQTLARWAVAYGTSVPALLVLALGVAGLFSCLCQYALLKAIEKEVPKIANEVGDFAGTVVEALNNASVAWSVGANSVINSTNTDINNNLFGWVNTTTHAINDTLNAFVDEMTKDLNATFGGTVLYGPITEVINCLIGLKIAGIEKGLTWVSDNAHIDFPEFSPDVFSLGAAASIASNASSTDSFLSSPGDVASDGITNAVTKVANKLEDGIQSEAGIAASLVGIWVFIVLIGIFRVLFAMMMREKTRAEGGPPGYTPQSPTRNNAAGFSAFGAPAGSVYPVQSREDPWEYENHLTTEKLRSTGQRVESSLKAGHMRSSSHGIVSGEKR